jgi:peptidoglycan hydrolase-like protein with peptidoglycan-binding domain
VRRRSAAALAGAAGIAGLGAIGLVLTNGGAGVPDTARAAAPAGLTTTVERRDLAVHEEVDGTLGYEDEHQIAARGAGTLTWVPKDGQVVRRGGVLYRVNDAPTLLLYGTIPAWRGLASGDEGRDVWILQRNLKAMGYDPDGDIDLDGEFGWATTAAVESWQEDIGVEETGSVRLGDVVVLPGPRQVVTSEAAVGDSLSPGAPVLTTSGERRAVTFELDAADQELVRKGSWVSITLPDGRRTSGAITEVGRAASSDAASEDAASEDETAQITVSVRLMRSKAVERFDAAPVTVLIEQERERDALVVPVNALVALTGGHYGVEVVEGGATRIVKVEPGTFADGQVAITGAGLRAGMRVGIAE